MLSDTVSLTEIIWVVPGIPSFLACVWAVRFFWRRYKAELDNGRNKASLAICAWRVARHVATTWIVFGLTLVGVIQMFLPPINPERPITFNGIVIVVAIFQAQVGLALLSVGEML